mmetsp:Transcript_38379/g.105715  ORF Transcript_38379/g.105715 Transcript_38379/m.105715 type:complete len:235 (-) Transcript_38379:74-778(-)|eukprot:CAMPEP_0117558364 /NCGR_PEP_ID=MMETSP0784-20121206/52795_1 /TAXON_ID=39447 /ORGANISM="" /LENGTH=234 /DNA_ID=CAMNT_0005355685 /DNA_START=80 /DNA_END=784 /DNA_ORIENTATION=+
MRFFALVAWLLAATARGLSLGGRGGGAGREVEQDQGSLAMSVDASEVLALLRDSVWQLNRSISAGSTQGAAENGTTASVAKAPPGALSANRSAALKQQQDVLQKLFANLKSNIKTMNKRETKGKDTSETTIARLRQRLDLDREKLNSTNLTAFDRERLVNRTRAEEHELAYWSRGRDLQHDMYRANLRMTHGLMSRVKKVMEAYSDVLANGKLDPKMADEMRMASGKSPKGQLY